MIKFNELTIQEYKEILDLYDENHNLTGKTITRGEKVENNYRK